MSSPLKESKRDIKSHHTDLSHRYSIMTRKVSPIVYNDYLLECARSLAAAEAVPSDMNLIYHVELAREAERVYTMFNYTETAQIPVMSDEQIQIYLNAFTIRINEWRARIPPTLTQDREFSLYPSVSFGIPCWSLSVISMDLLLS